MSSSESQLEDQFIGKMRDLKYTYRPDIRDRAALEDNFRKKFNLLNRVTLTDGEFAKLLDGIVTASRDTATNLLSALVAELTVPQNLLGVGLGNGRLLPTKP